MQLFLYAQNNGKNSRIILGDVPSTSIHKGIDPSSIDKRAFYIFNIFCLVFPFVLYLLMLLIIHSCRPKIRSLFAPPLSSGSFNQNYAALILTGLVFSVYVVVCDILAVYNAFKPDSEFQNLDLYEKSEIKIFDKYITVTISGLDSIAFILSLLTITILGLNTICGKRNPKLENLCFEGCFKCFICICYCRISSNCCKCSQHKYGYFQFEAKDQESDSETTIATKKKKAHAENKAWVLTLAFVGPLVCFGTHASFVIMALSSDPSSSSSMTVIVTLSFFYYFFGFRQLYIVLTSFSCIKPNQQDKQKPEPNTSTELNSLPTEGTQQQGVETISGQQDNQPQIDDAVVQQTVSGQQDNRPQIDNAEVQQNHENVSPACCTIKTPAAELAEQHENLKEFNFIALFIELQVGIVLVAI